MKINKIKLYNFSSYEGENVFDFSLESENKNIVLIGGKNGAGNGEISISLSPYFFSMMPRQNKPFCSLFR